MLTLQIILDVWQRHLITMRTIEHLHMFSIALVLSILIGVLVGVFIYMRPKTAEPVLNFLNIVETIPDLALIVLLLPILKLGAGPTIAACVLYSILPIARNTYTGLRGVDDQYTYVANEIGLSPVRHCSR